jgi:hypothetical protein
MISTVWGRGGLGLGFGVSGQSTYYHDLAQLTELQQSRWLCGSNYIHTHIHTHTHTYIHGQCVSNYIHTHTQAHIHTYTHTRTRTRTRTRTHTHTQSAQLLESPGSTHGSQNDRITPNHTFNHTPVTPFPLGRRSRATTDTVSHDSSPKTRCQVRGQVPSFFFSGQGYYSHAM